MSFQNPFSNLVRREYNVTNLKKILDTFPTSLSVEQLTSTQLLEMLRNTVRNRDITIEELLARLANRGQTSDDLEGINNTLSELSQELNLGNLVEETVAESELNAKVQELRARGFTQISDSPLWVLVERDNIGGTDFNMDHTDENDGHKPTDLKSPNSLRFVNLDEENPVWFMKKELWTDDEDGYASPGRFDGSPHAPTNVFSITDFPNSHMKAYKIKPNADTSTGVRLYYDSKGDYRRAGLKRSGATNTWFGFMQMKAIGGSTPSGIDSVESTEIGSMRLYRDKN